MNASPPVLQNIRFRTVNHSKATDYWHFITQRKKNHKQVERQAANRVCNARRALWGQIWKKGTADHNLLIHKKCKQWAQQGNHRFYFNNEMPHWWWHKVQSKDLSKQIIGIWRCFIGIAFIKCSIRVIFQRGNNKECMKALLLTVIFLYSELFYSLSTLLHHVQQS